MALRQYPKKRKYPRWDELDPAWVQSILDDEMTIPQIAREVGIPATTLHKAIEEFGLEYDRGKVLEKVEKDIERIMENARERRGG